MRFVKDVKYDLLVPPLGLEYSKMTPKQVRENFEWFISRIPERIEYLTNRCAQDLNITVNELNLSPDSLKIIWRWFLKTARIEKVPKEEVAKLEKNVGHLGEHWIIREQLTVTSQFILRDIGMYLGETFIKNHNSIRWDYFMRPQNEVSARKPVLLGFVYIDPTDKSQVTSLPFDPIGLLEYIGHKIVSKTQKETDLYEVYVERLKFLPAD